MTYFLLLLALTTWIPIASAQTGCFFPNGVESERAYYGTCSKNTQDPLSKICCAVNRPNPPGSDEALGEPQDLCLPNGLCAYMAEKSGVNTTAYYRNLCTERDWKTGGCLDVCTSGDLFNINTEVTPCDGTATSEKWCCGRSTACCEAGPGNPGAVSIAQIFLGATVRSSTIAGSSSITVSATSGASTSTIPSQSAVTDPNRDPDDASNSDKGLSNGAKIGVVVGVIAASMAVVTLIFFIVRAHRYKKKIAAMKKIVNPVSESPVNIYQSYPAEGKLPNVQYRHEAPDTCMVSELHNDALRHELPGVTKDGTMWARRA